MMRFGSHLLLVLRSLLADQMKDTFREKIMTVGDYIIHMLAMYIFTKEYEGLVVIYASQLAHHHCVDLCVYMMEMRLNSRTSRLRSEHKVIGDSVALLYSSFHNK